METIIDKALQDQRLSIDNKSVVNCTLTNCTLEYHGAPVSFYASHLKRCKYIFSGPAKRTVIFLQETGLMPFNPAEWGDAKEGME